MDFELSEEHKMLKELVRDFMTREVEPLAEKIDRDNELPDGIHRKLGELGLLCMAVPTEYEGPGFDHMAQLICTEEISRICPAVAMACCIGHSVVCGDTINNNGTEEQKRKYLPPLCRGEKIGAFALSEPEAGSDATALQTTAKKAGNEYVINGSKCFITNGSVADIFIVFAKTNVEAGARGITAFIAERGYPGSLEATDFNKMGFRGARNSQVFFEDYRVPAENILGGENQGMSVMLSGLDIERIINSGACLGIAERCLELSLKYAKQRVQFGQPIAKFQLVQKMLAETYVMLESSRLLAYKAVNLAQNAGGERSSEVHKLAVAAAFATDEAVQKAAWNAVQIHGGYGYMMNHSVNRLFRDSRLMSIGGGTTEIRILTMARELLKEVA